VLAYFGIAALIILAATAREQELVLFYAVAVFVGFLSGLLAMARFAAQEGDRVIVALNSMAILAVTFTLVVNVARVYPLVSLAAMAVIAALLHRQWRRAGRPGGAEAVERASGLV
jgi:hypothetical protein